jgi:DNA-binding GntR family transcriptional regulator
MKSLRRRNLRDDAIDVLRAAILGGELAPGSIHSAVTLADRLGVSPTPVREAMLALVVSGLVEVVPNRGFRVTVIDDRDLDEIFELRLILEVTGIELAASRGADADVELLGARLAELEAAAASSDVPAYLVADRAFHLELLALAGNDRLVRIVAELRDQARITGLRTLAETATLAITAAEHRPLLEAVRARDAPAAQRIMTSHLAHTRAEWAGRAD